MPNLDTMRRTLDRLSVFVLALAVVVRGFEAGYFHVRAVAVVPADSLLHYHWILSWWRHGDSIRGFTLTPSPYFIDLAIQLPIAFLTGDFESFSYVMASTFAVLLFLSVYAVMRIAFDGSTLIASVVAGLALVAFYVVAPFSVVVHAFMSNHTSEVYSTLGLVVLVHVLFRPQAPRRRYAPALYIAALMACVVSSPFFIATYCVPVAIAATALLGTSYVSWRRLAWFLGYSVFGALAGLMVLAVISRYVWPVRGDLYSLTARDSYDAFATLLATDIGVGRTAKVTVVAAIASAVLAVIGRRTGKLSEPVTFLLAFFPATLLGCVLLPMKRGALGGAYELRFLQLPWLLACGFYAAALIVGVRALARTLLRGRALPRQLAWAGVIAPVVAAIALVGTARGPLSMFDPESRTASELRCIKTIEDSGALKDGIATAYIARYMNAARHASEWKSPYVVVQIYPASPTVINAGENNILWLNDGYRHGSGTMNFVATHLLDDKALASLRTRIGEPDRTISCPLAFDHRLDGKGTFDFWIYDRPEAQQRLTKMVTRDNYRGAFAPLVGANAMDVDLDWGAFAEPAEGEYIRGHRVWRRGVHLESGTMAIVRPFFAPSGKYRVEIDLTAVPHKPEEGQPLAELHIYMDRKPRIKRVPIRIGTTHAVVEFNVKNLGGPTSGAAVWMNVVAQAAESIEISSIKLTLIKPSGIDPLRIFR